MSCMQLVAWNQNTAPEGNLFIVEWRDRDPRCGGKSTMTFDGSMVLNSADVREFFSERHGSSFIVVTECVLEDTSEVGTYYRTRCTTTPESDKDSKFKQWMESFVFWRITSEKEIVPTAFERAVMPNLGVHGIVQIQFDAATYELGESIRDFKMRVLEIHENKVTEHNVDSWEAAAKINTDLSA